MTPPLFSARSRPEIAPINAVIDPITLGVLFRRELSPEPESSSGPEGGSGSLMAEHLRDGRPHLLRGVRAKERRRRSLPL